MRVTMAVHILAGLLGLVFGYVALYAAKGAGLHKKSGRLFVYAMLVLGSTGALIAALNGGEASVIAGFLAAYLVTTALTTVRPRTETSRRLEVFGAGFALVLGLASVALGIDAISRGGVREGIPAPVLFKFAIVSLLSTVGDVRILRSGPLVGAPRLTRHLWRMCFALYIAAASFFLGQADEFPQALQSPLFTAPPVLAVIVTLLYWLWRVRIRRSLRGLVVGGVAAPVRVSAAPPS